MDQSLFTRFVRIGIPYIEPNSQGRARPSIAKLCNWRYRDLGDLPYVKEGTVFHRANAGFSYEYQLVDVPYYLGKKLLIRDVINRRCVPYDFIGPPSKRLGPRFALKLNEVASYIDRHVEDTGPIHLISNVDEIFAIYQQLYQVSQYAPSFEKVIVLFEEMAFAWTFLLRQVALQTGVIEEQNSHQNPKSESAPENVPDESNMEEDTEVNMLSNGQNEVLPSESPLNKELDENPESKSQGTKMEE
ncbi:Intron-binding protein aquarius [Trema orientale]|uniref:Intron-binding protein aquarius n=1 Tax=Trema orientale TaxID=63057 RepID=A0A2P5BQV7_TREOI|nr:Intron-binding protein aquarius [Trema orientale]